MIGWFFRWQNAKASPKCIHDLRASCEQKNSTTILDERRLPNEDPDRIGLFAGGKKWSSKNKTKMQASLYVREDPAIYIQMRLSHTTRGASLIPCALRTFRKSFYVAASEIGILCPFWTFTIFVLLCKVNRH